MERVGDGLDPALMQALASPETDPGRPPVTVVATHTSVVFLAGDRAYKVKKPVRFQFLDYSSRARRLEACREELRVNRRLAPGIYVSVRAICPVRASAPVPAPASIPAPAPVPGAAPARGTAPAPAPAPAGFALREDGAPGAVEHAVEMVRFAEADTMAGAIAAGRLVPEQVREVGALLAAFHRDGALAEGGGPQQVLAAWRRNLAELAQVASTIASVREMLDPARLQAARRFGEAFVAAHAREMAERAREGHVRDGHGDLRCEHVLLAPSVQIVDRIEFDASLRRGDVAGDLAFLTMDLQLHRQAWAARELVAAYRHAGGSPGSEQLRSFHAAHRALVRAKVALLAADAETEGEGKVRRAPPGRAARVARGVSGSPGGAARAALAEAGRLVALSERLAWRARRPLAIVVCGPSASGKSTLAARLARVTGLQVVSSDVVRKRLAGIAPTERGRAGMYAEVFTHATYDELSRRALGDVRARGGVIVDATCRTRGQRALIVRRLRRSGCTLLFAVCEVPLEVALARAAARMSGERVSDATVEVVGAQHRAFQPLRELAPESVLRLDATLPIEQQVQALAGAVDAATVARFSALPRRSGALTR